MRFCCSRAARRIWSPIFAIHYNVTRFGRAQVPIRRSIRQSLGRQPKFRTNHCFGRLLPLHGPRNWSGSTITKISIQSAITALLLSSFILYFDTYVCFYLICLCLLPLPLNSFIFIGLIVIQIYLCLFICVCRFLSPSIYLLLRHFTLFSVLSISFSHSIPALPSLPPVYLPHRSLFLVSLPVIMCSISCPSYFPASFALPIACPRFLPSSLLIIHPLLPRPSSLLLLPHPSPSLCLVPSLSTPSLVPHANVSYISRLSM